MFEWQACWALLCALSVSPTSPFQGGGGDTQILYQEVQSAGPPPNVPPALLSSYQPCDRKKSCQTSLTTAQQRTVTHSHSFARGVSSEIMHIITIILEITLLMGPGHLIMSCSHKVSHFTTVTTNFAITEERKLLWSSIHITAAKLFRILEKKNYLHITNESAVVWKWIQCYNKGIQSFYLYFFCFHVKTMIISSMFVQAFGTKLTF